MRLPRQNAAAWDRWKIVLTRRSRAIVGKPDGIRIAQIGRRVREANPLWVRPPTLHDRVATGGHEGGGSSPRRGYDEEGGGPSVSDHNCDATCARRLADDRGDAEKRARADRGERRSLHHREKGGQAITASGSTRPGGKGVLRPAVRIGFLTTFVGRRCGMWCGRVCPSVS
jgi:hypothetical protein